MLLILNPCLRGGDPDTAFNNQFRKEIGGWIAADATYSIYLPDGSTLWLFGDTFIGEVDENNAIVPGAKFIRNSAVLQEGETLTTLFSGTRQDPGDFIPTPHPDSTWYWPEHGLVEGDSLRIFLAKFRHNPEGPPGFQFEHAGNDIGTFTYPGLDFVHATPVEASFQNGVLYGDRILEDTTHLYIYGRKSDPEFNIPYPHAARAPVGKLMEQEWEFYDGTGWSHDPAATGRINNFQVSQQYSVSTYNGKYILLTQDIWLSPKIYTFTSSSPVGPWKNQRLIYTTPESAGDVFTYNAYVHPQFDENREMLVSYNVNGDFWSIFSNVEIYRPRFVRIPYMNLDYAFWPTGFRDVRAGSQIEARLFPNPVTGPAVIHLLLHTPDHVTIDLLDISGRILSTKEFPGLTAGAHQIELQLAHLENGAYLFRIGSGRTRHLLQMIKTTN